VSSIINTFLLKFLFVVLCTSPLTVWQISMERLAIPKQAFLDPWREVRSTALHFVDSFQAFFLLHPVTAPTCLLRVDCILQFLPSQNSILYRGSTDGTESVVNPASRRADIPAAVHWLRHNGAPATDQVRRALAQRAAARDDDMPPAGGAHPLLGTLAIAGRAQGQAGSGDRYWQRLTAGFTEEEKRQHLATGGRRRRFADVKHQPTDTLGAGKPLPLSGFQGGPVPTGPRYKSGAANPWPKLAVEPLELNGRAPELGDPRLAAYPLASRTRGQSNRGSRGGGGGSGSSGGGEFGDEAAGDAAGTLDHPASWASQEPSYVPLSGSSGRGPPLGSASLAGSVSRSLAPGSLGGSLSTAPKPLLSSAATRAPSSKPQSVGGQGPNDFSPWVATRWGSRQDPRKLPAAAARQQNLQPPRDEPSDGYQQSRSREQVSFEDNGSFAADGAFLCEAFPEF
jgi:uncharacterized membrane protein YgcG